MRSQYLKIRMSPTAYAQLKTRAAEAGKTISSFSNQLLETENDIASIKFQLDAINDQLNNIAVQISTMSQKTNSEDKYKFVLFETLLISREIAIQTNAQIMNKVTTKISQLKGDKK